jgi:hypothetical protein
METKELKIQAPEGYEIDKENSTFERIRFKPIKNITYEDVCNRIFNICNGDTGYYIDNTGNIKKASGFSNGARNDKNNATNERQLEKLLALNQLLNIAEYYNSINSNKNGEYFHIVFHPSINYTIYCRKEYFLKYGLLPFFNRKEDAQAVIDNPNFREILDTIYKG